MPPTKRKTTKKGQKKGRNLTLNNLPKFVVVKQGRWYVVRKVTVIKKGVKTLKAFWRRCDPETPENAGRIADEIRAQIDALKQGYGGRPQYLFGDVCDEFERVELIEAIYDSHGRKLAGRRSLEGPRIIVRSLKERFGHLDIRNISFGDISNFKHDRLTTPVRSKNKVRPRTIRAVNYELSFLRQVFHFAMRRRWLERSPFQDGKGLIDGAAENRRYVTWTKDEETQALSLCVGKSRHMKPFIILCVDGGLRPGECLSLKWSDVADGHLLAKTYKGKNLQTRKVLLSQRMKEVLEWWREIQKKYESRVTPDRRKVIGFASVKGSWERIAKDIGRPDMIAHDLRHIYASRLAKAGVPITTISRALGHANIATTFRYINPDAPEMIDTVDVIDRLNDLG